MFLASVTAGGQASTVQALRRLILALKRPRRRRPRKKKKKKTTARRASSLPGTSAGPNDRALLIESCLSESGGANCCNPPPLLVSVPAQFLTIRTKPRSIGQAVFFPFWACARLPIIREHKNASLAQHQPGPQRQSRYWKMNST